MVKNIKAAYVWHATANTMLRRREAHNLTDADLAEWYDMRESDVRELLTMRNCAAEYLRSRGKENHWSLVSDTEHAFREVVAGRARLENAGERELFTQAAFLLIDNADTLGARLYELIPNIQEYMAPIKEKLRERFNI
jgi:hypothetical protein